MATPTPPQAAETPAGAEPRLKLRVTRTEASAIALHVELLKREGKPIPKWMRQVADAV